jgi:hypothetical protein
MTRRFVPALAASAALLVPSVALADHRPGHPAPGGGGGGGGGGATATTISALDAKPSTLVFGASTVLSGRLAGGTVSGVNVRLEADETRPYGDAYKAVNGPNGAPLTVASDKSGRFAFTLRPQRNTQYRAVAQSSPPVTSAARLVLVRPLVGLIVSDSTPRAGSFVRFRGTVRPAHDGATALIQRRSSTGRFVTVARTALRDAGTVYSSYSRRIRVNRDGVYRVKVAGDADHVNGFSALRTLNAS